MRVLKHFAPGRNILGRHGFNAKLLRFEMHRRQDREVIHHRTDGGRDDDIAVRDIGDLGHHKGRRTHHGWHQRTAHGSGTFNPGSDRWAIANAHHQRNGHGPRGDHIGH